MICPVCGGDTKVTETRKDCKSVHRRRYCPSCLHSFFTTETESDGDELKAIERDLANKLRKRGTTKCL